VRVASVTGSRRAIALVTAGRGVAGHGNPCRAPLAACPSTIRSPRPARPWSNSWSASPSRTKTPASNDSGNSGRDTRRQAADLFARADRENYEHCLRHHEACGAAQPEVLARAESSALRQLLIEEREQRAEGHLGGHPGAG